MGNKIHTEGSYVFIGDADELHHYTSQRIRGGWQQTAKQGPKKRIQSRGLSASLITVNTKTQI